MTEERIAKARAAAELEVERIFKHTLVEVYMKGFMRGIESAEDEDAALKRLNEEAEAFESGAVPKDEPMVRLKPDAILKRRLRREDFPTRVWRTFQKWNIEVLGDILQTSEKKFLSQPGFGLGSMNFLRNYVRQYGYELKEK